MKLFVICLPFCQSMRSHGFDINELSVACSIAKKQKNKRNFDISRKYRVNKTDFDYSKQVVNHKTFTQSRNPKQTICFPND